MNPGDNLSPVRETSQPLDVVMRLDNQLQLKIVVLVWARDDPLLLGTISIWTTTLFVRAFISLK